MAFPSAACHHSPQLCQLKGPEPTPLHSVHRASLCCLHCRWRETSTNLTIIAQSKLGTIHITSCISSTGRVSCSPGLWRWPCLQRIQHFTKQMASYGLSSEHACGVQKSQSKSFPSLNWRPLAPCSGTGRTELLGDEDLCCCSLEGAVVAFQMDIRTRCFFSPILKIR